MLQDVLSMLSFRSFIVSGLTFRPLSHFKFIFIYGATCNCPLFPAPLVYFWNAYLVPLICVSVSLSVAYCFDYYSIALIVWAEAREYSSFSSVFSQDCFG